MKKYKRVLKFQIKDYWKIGEHENYFSDMAKKGFHLEKINALFMYFIKSKPQNMRYRITLAPLNEIEKAYNDKGWRYVSSYGRFSIFSSPEELHAPEMHHHQKNIYYINKALNKHCTFISILTALTILITGLYTFFLFFKNYAFLELLDGILENKIIVLIILLILTISTIRYYIYIRDLKSTFNMGFPINYGLNWKKRKAFSTVFFCSLSVLCIGFFGISFANQLSQESVGLLEKKNPIIVLNDLDEIPRNTSYLPEKNIYFSDSSLLLAKRYISVEKALIQDADNMYFPKIENRFYKVRFKLMSSILFNALLKYSNMEDESTYIASIEDENFDDLVILNKQIYKEVIAYKDDIVIYVKYLGTGTVKDVIEEVKENIEYY